jgi:hypothetical protein
MLFLRFGTVISFHINAPYILVDRGLITAKQGNLMLGISGIISIFINPLFGNLYGDKIVKIKF